MYSSNGILCSLKIIIFYVRGNLSNRIRLVSPTPSSSPSSSVALAGVVRTAIHPLSSSHIKKTTIRDRSLYSSWVILS
jgi:hypothetical protein